MKAPALLLLVCASALADDRLAEYAALDAARDWACRTDMECEIEDAAKQRGEECRIILADDPDNETIKCEPIGGKTP